jgi:hypothetical protein
LRPDANIRVNSQPIPRAHDGLLLAGLLLVLLPITAFSLAVRPISPPGIPATPPWCLPRQQLQFQLGFLTLSQALGPIMGRPTECEHGYDVNGDTRQRTTTGIAIYNWCTNTPSFNAGRDHWILGTGGVEHWTDPASPPEMPIVRAPDLRQPCPA